MEEANAATRGLVLHNAPATQNELLQSRYELVYLIFQFAISLAVLIGVFLLIVVFQQGAVASGGIALSTIVVSYWLGLGLGGRKLH
jgi:hypothetical protein